PPAQRNARRRRHPRHGHCVWRRAVRLLHLSRISRQNLPGSSKESKKIINTCQLTTATQVLGYPLAALGPTTDTKGECNEYFDFAHDDYSGVLYCPMRSCRPTTSDIRRHGNGGLGSGQGHAGNPREVRLEIM